MPRPTTRSAVVLAGIVAASLGVAPAMAATAKATSLNLRAAHTTVAPKAKDTLTGTLKSGSSYVAGEKVTLERRAGTSGKFTVVKTVVTGKNGTASFTVVPGTKTGQKVQYELVHAADAKYKASHSQIITVTVK
jgi:hypothetical protein